MARKAIKKPSSATGGKQAIPTGVKAPKDAQAAPRAAEAVSSPVLPGSSLPAVIPPVPPPTVPKKRHQSQKGSKLPGTPKMRARVAAIVALQIQGFTSKEIAEKLGFAEASIRQWKWMAGKYGWLKTDDPHEHAENVIIHKVVKGLEELVDYRDPDTKLPRQEVILEASKGLGIFKDHSKPQEVVAQQANMLSVNLVFPEGSRPEMRAGTQGGIPAYIDVEAVKS